MFRRWQIASFVAGCLCASVIPAPARSAAAALAPSLATRSNPMTIVLDETTAPRGFVRTHMTIPVAPGPFTVVYPEWIPGEHGPTGPLNDLTELKISANGTQLAWSRDQVDLYAFHVTVPAGVTAINADFTVLLNAPGDVMSTPSVMVGNWNRYLLYQHNIDNTRYFVKASLIVAPQWDYASALPVAHRSGRRVDFQTVSLETLVDSPTDSGRYYKHITTWSGAGTHTYLDIFADHSEDLDIPKKTLDAYKRMTAEAIALYGGRHWSVYHSELTLSDAIGSQGIEHHQSSDDRASDDFMTNPKEQIAGGDLLTHEFSHSWNGKYRRPFDLQQPNYNVPEHTELLWQYEGMNQYMGDLLSFRAGIREPKDYPEYLASIYAQMAYEPGRRTTPIIDTTTGAPYFYVTSGDYPSLRRSANDFYTEGELMWLDADTIIREKTHGRKSLDDYTKIFAGGVSGPRVVTYTRTDLERYLNTVVRYDWHDFFQKWVYTIVPQPPADELARAGYRFVLTDRPNMFMSAALSIGHGIDTWYGAGLTLDKDATITDVREGSAAWRAGLGTDMTVIAVNGRTFSSGVWSAALRAATKSTAPILLIVQQGDRFTTIALDYHGGVKYPHLVRLPGTHDMLLDIMKPHAK
jgi:predicted metalloprotease with PDZ domain